jgi:hypothetical protein
MKKINRHNMGKQGVVFKEKLPLKAFFIKGLQRVPKIKTLVLLNDILIE